MANDNCYSHNGAPKYKRRRVSAIRDFPPGCGRFASRITVEQTKNSVYVASSPNMGTAADAVDTSWGGHVDSRVRDSTAILTQASYIASSPNKGTAAEAVDTSWVGHFDSRVGDSTAILTQTSVVESCLKTLGQAADVVDGLSSVNEEQPTGMSLGALELTGIVEPRKASESELFERDGGVAAAPQDKDTTESSYAYFCSGYTSLTTGSSRTCLQKSKARSYPPRRRVSAIRTFPPDCGRNAPLRDKEACSTVAAPLKEIKVSEESPLKDQKNLRRAEVTGTYLVKEMLRDQDSQECKSLNEVTEAAKAEVWAEHEENSVGSKRERDKLGTISEMNIKPEDANDGWGGSPCGSNQDLFVCQSEAFLDKRIRDIEISGEKWAKKTVAYKKGESLKRKHADISGNQVLEDNTGSSEVSSERVLVQGLMAAPFCPWQQSKEERKLSSPNNMTARIRKKKDPIGPGKSKLTPKKKDPIGPEKSKLTSKVKLIEEKTFVGKTPLKGQPFKEDYAHESTSELVVWENPDVVDTDEHHEYLQVTLHPRAFTVNPPPFGQGLSEGQSNADVTRNEVRKTLRLFQAVCRKLLQEEEAKTKGESKHKRIDLQAAKMLKDQKRFVNTGKQILGPVPGVEVGDEFQYRVELNIIGLHRQIQGGIDYFKRGGKVLATSIVSSGSYCDDLDNSDFVIYTGSGGNVIGKDKEPEDQRLEKGNLALSNSISERNPVRVIRGLKETRSSDFSDAKYRTVFTYTYDGLYVVEECWQEPGPHGKLVFKFRLNRIPGQPELAWKVVKKSKKSEAREGLCVRDISQGKESVAIGVVNTIDNEKPLPFKYITRMIYPDWLQPTPSRSCDCSRGCSDTAKCICTVKNGGEIPYNHNGAIVEAKPLVYECGRFCKCPSSCHNRVTQRGLKFQLEIFKTELRGWGVRSLNSIPSGSFICEYIGELLEDKEAEERTGNDEYLFDIGNNYDDSNLWDGLSTLMPDAHMDSCEVVEEVGFTIDAAKYGNVGRFINHSCSPNLYAQNVLYDHEDKRVPHIMFFAAENIPPLQELTYHYNYTIGQVHDSNGNIKKKNCYCGSSECMGRMY